MGSKERKERREGERKGGGGGGEEVPVKSGVLIDRADRFPSFISQLHTILKKSE